MERGIIMSKEKLEEIIVSSKIGELFRKKEADEEQKKCYPYVSDGNQHVDDRRIRENVGQDRGKDNEERQGSERIGRRNKDVTEAAFTLE